MTAVLSRGDRGPKALPIVEKVLAHWFGGWTGSRLIVELNGGRVIVFGTESGPDLLLELKDTRALWRPAFSGSLGWAKGYIEGEWDTPDLAGLLTAAAQNRDVLRQRGSSGVFLSRMFHRLMHRMHANTRTGSRRNIAAHYDLGDEFYRLWLDPGMTYSAALFEDFSEPLETAQIRKYRRLCEQLGLRRGVRVLEIGCGWGGFAELAARDFGCRVTALTVSERQAAHAQARIDRAGLTSQVEIRLQDYRDVNERFDAIASIEMFEAVGAENWPDYFRTLRRCLAPGGKAAVQTITIEDSKYDTYRQSADFIQRFVFPGGMLPSARVFREHASASGFAVGDEFFFGAHYGETLRRWRRAFGDARLEVATLGFDARFRRLWEYYLCYCEAGFTTNQIDVGQFVLIGPT